MHFIWYSASPPNERGVGLVRQKVNRALGEDLRAGVDRQVPFA